MKINNFSLKKAYYESDSTIDESDDEETGDNYLIVEIHENSEHNESDDYDDDDADDEDDDELYDDNDIIVYYR